MYILSNSTFIQNAPKPETTKINFKVNEQTTIHTYNKIPVIKTIIYLCNIVNAS